MTLPFVSTDVQSTFKYNNSASKNPCASDFSLRPFAMLFMFARMASRSVLTSAGFQNISSNCHKDSYLRSGFEHATGNMCDACRLTHPGAPVTSHTFTPALRSRMCVTKSDVRTELLDGVEIPRELPCRRVTRPCDVCLLDACLLDACLLDAEWRLPDPVVPVRVRVDREACVVALG